MSLPLKLDKTMLAENAAEVMVYFEKHKIMEIVARLIGEIVLERPEDAQLWIAENIVRIAADIYSNCLEISYNGGAGDVRFYQLPGRYLHRVVVFGRRGSGRKTQAIALVKRFNLIYLDAEHLIYQSLRATDPLSKQLQQAFLQNNVPDKSKVLGQIICRRLLQMDALRHGWVLVNYPNSLAEIKELFEQFKIPPNKFVYLKCPELMAKRRLVTQPNLGRPQSNCEFMQLEMNYFNQHESEINQYLARRHETIYVDSTPCFEAVKTKMLALLDRRPYVMGFKA